MSAGDRPDDNDVLGATRLVEIDRACHRFEADWRAGRRPAIEDCLAGTAGPDRAALLRELLAVELEYRASAGVRPDPAEYRARFPVDTGLVDAALARMEVPSTEADDGAKATDAVAVGSAAADGRRFRALRPHAQGGLGAVFVALDRELNREVALKQILDHHADDLVSRSRFLVEAEITGRLEHPGIVPVYSLGTYGDGRPYYAMRFVHGDSLKEAIERFHTDPALKNGPGRRSLELRKLLRRFLDVCNTIEYAHSRGVLHRDIKPANVIVGKYGETLVVDWGLAKPLKSAEPGSDSGEQALLPSSASGSAETLPGSAVGTPAYMSPEQAAGDLERLGPQSDVYALGATLYCLLTGKPPFEGEAGAVLPKVRTGDFPPPRQHDPALDPALEAVCLTAMATPPEERYPTCRALADDVERWMADEPVSCWREPLGRRARRWASRHRTGVAAAAVGLVAGLVGLAAVLAVQTSAKTEIARSLEHETRANQALATSNARLAEANAELGRSQAAVQARYDLAVAAVKTFHTGVSRDFLLQQDQFKELRDRLLQSAADFYGKLSAMLGKETDPASRRALGRSNFELAVLTSSVGGKQDALAAHQAVLAAREALAAEPGADAAATVEVGRSLTEVAMLLRETGKPDDAVAAYRRSESLLAGRAETDPAARAALAASRSNLGLLLQNAGKTADALAVYRRARADREVLANAPGASNDARSDLAETVMYIGRLLLETGKLPEAEAETRVALAIMESVVAENPASTEFRERLAGIHNNLGLVQLGSGNSSGAEVAHRKALAIGEKLAADYPAVTHFRYRVAVQESTLGSFLGVTGRRAEAEAAYRKALAIHERLAGDDPTVIDFPIAQATAHYNLGLLFATSRPAEAEAAYRKALEIGEKLAADYPAVTHIRYQVAVHESTLGNLLSATGRPAEAEAAYRKALAIHERLAGDDPAVPNYRLAQANLHYNLGLLFATSRPSEAEAAYRKALEIRERVGDDAPTVITFRFRNFLAEIHSSLGNVLSATSRPAEAEAAYRKALAIRERLADDHPTVIDFRDSLADIHFNLGNVLSATSRPTEAEAAYRKALAIWEKLTTDAPAVARFRTGLADSHDTLGRLLSATGRLSDAEAQFRQALAIYQKWAGDHPEVPADRSRGANYASHLSIALRRLGRPIEARDVAGWAIAVSDAAVREDPKTPKMRAALAENSINRGLARLALGDPAGASADFRQVLAWWNTVRFPNGEDTFLFACARAALAGLAGQPGSGVPAAEAVTEADAAMALLRQAVTLGYRTLDTYRTSDALDPLSNRDDFRLLMLDLAMPADPFAPAR